MTFPTLLTDGTKQTIFDWFQDREVTNEEKFNIYFNRTLNRDLPQFYQLLRIEPGFEESGVAQYDWFVEDYEELERTHNGFNTSAGNHDLAEVIRKSIGSVTKTEGADVDASSRKNASNGTVANAKQNTNGETVQYTGGQMSADNEKADGSTSYNGSHITSDSEQGNENVQYNGGRTTAETGTENDSTNYNGNRVMTEASVGKDDLNYQGGTNRDGSDNGSEVQIYQGSEKTNQTRTPNLVRSTLNDRNNGSDSITKNANKIAPQSVSYPTTGGVSNISSGGSREGGKLQDFNWDYMTGQTQQDGHTSENESNAEAVIENGSEQTDNTKTFNDRSDSRGHNTVTSTQDRFVDRHDIRDAENAKVTNEGFQNRSDEKSGTNAKASVEQYNDREDLKSNVVNKASVESYNDRSDDTTNTKANVHVEQYNDRQDKRNVTENESNAEYHSDDENGVEVQTHSKGTTVTVTPTGDDDTSSSKTTEANVGTDSNTEHEQRTGRHGYPSDILEHAYSFIKTSSAWIWLQDRLEICFMQVL